MGPKEKHAHAQPCFFNSTHKVTPRNGVDVWDPPFSKLNLYCGAQNHLHCCALRAKPTSWAGHLPSQWWRWPTSTTAHLASLPNWSTTRSTAGTAAPEKCSQLSSSCRFFISQAPESCFQQHEQRIGKRNCNFFVSFLRLAPTGKLTFHPLTALLIWIVARYCQSHWESDQCSANTGLRFSLIHREAVLVHERR